MTLQPRKDTSGFNNLVSAWGESACLAEVGKVVGYQEGSSSNAKKSGKTSLRMEGLVAWMVILGKLEESWHSA